MSLIHKFVSFLTTIFCCASIVFSIIIVAIGTILVNKYGELSLKYSKQLGGALIAIGILCFISAFFGFYGFPRDTRYHFKLFCIYTGISVFTWEVYWLL